MLESYNDEIRVTFSPDLITNNYQTHLVQIEPLSLLAAGTYYCSLQGTNLSPHRSNEIKLNFDSDTEQPSTTPLPPVGVQLTANTQAVGVTPFEITCSVENFHWQLGRSIYINFAYSSFSLSSKPVYTLIGNYYVGRK